MVNDNNDNKIYLTTHDERKRKNIEEEKRHIMTKRETRLNIANFIYKKKKRKI